MTETDFNSTETGDDSLSLAVEIKKLNTAELTEFLRKEDQLRLIKEDFDIIEHERISGLTFLKITEEKLRSYGMKGGPASALADFAKGCREKKLRPFSSYTSLNEVLEKYNLDSYGLDAVPLFIPRIHKIQDSNKVYKRCMKEILGRLRTYRSLQLDSFEIMRNECVVAILHAAIHIVMDETNNNKLTMCSQRGLVGEESKSWVDFAIKEAEDLLCITENKQHKIPLGIAQNIKQLESAYETNKRKRKRDDGDFDYIYGIVTTGQDWHFLLYTPGAISKGSKLPYTIKFTDDALNKNSKEYHKLREEVKEVLEIVIGLIKDRVSCVGEEPDRKKTKIESYRSR